MKRDTFLPSLTTLLIFGMAVFLSCAHQNRVRDGLNEEEVAASEEENAFVSEEGSTGTEGEQPSGELADLSSPPVEGETTEELPLEGSEQAPVEGSAEATPTQDADLQALGIESTTPPEGTGLESTTETQAIDSAAGAVTTDPNTVASTNTETGLDPLAGLEDTGTGAVVGGLGDSTTSSETGTTDLSALTEPSATNNIEITRMEPIIDSGAGSRGAIGGGDISSGSTWSGTSSVPKIPSKSVTRRGVELNRFYMARVGDTPASVSRLFYGNEDHTADITKWNGKSWSPGKVLYYKSAIEPNDTTMRSFYQEKGVQPEEYTIAKGDWLSKVAKRTLGHPRSWKEIAVVNGMNSPDSIEVGQKIAIYPKDLSGYSNTPVAEAPKEEPVQQPVAQNPEPIQPQQPEFQQPQNQPVDPNAELAKQMPPEPPPMQEPPRVEKAQPLDSAKLVEQNLPAIFILGGVLVLSALYLIVRRKKSSRSLDDFGDENFAPPTKLKRK